VDADSPPLGVGVIVTDSREGVLGITLVVIRPAVGLVVRWVLVFVARTWSPHAP
jgi:hypothetical protein